MIIRRREFIGTASAAMVAGMATAKLASAQEGNAPAKAPPVPTRQAKVERLFKAPDIHPNALEAAPDGLWIGDQVSERVFKVGWKDGKVLHEVQTESHNTSGIAVGAGYLWLGANGGVSGRRPPRPDRKSTRLNSSHVKISYAVFCLKKKTHIDIFECGEIALERRQLR